MSAENTTNLEDIRASLKAGIEDYIESNRKRTDSYLSLAMDIESMFEYAQSIKETDAETAASISQLLIDMMPRWKEMTLIATDGRFEEAFSIYQYIRLEVDLAREGHLRPHLQVAESDEVPAADSTEDEPENTAPEELSFVETDPPENIQLVDETFFDFLRDDVTLELDQLSLTLGKIIANKGEESDWKTLRLLCDSIKESSVVFGFNSTIDIAEAAWQIAYAADQYPAQRTVETAKNIVEVLKGYAALLELPFDAVESDSKTRSNESLTHHVSIRSTPVAAGLARMVSKPKLKVTKTVTKQILESAPLDIPVIEAESPSYHDEPIAEQTTLRFTLEEPTISDALPTGIIQEPHPSLSNEEEKQIEDNGAVATIPDSSSPPVQTEPPPSIEPESTAEPLDQELRDLFRDEAAGYLGELAVELRCLRSAPHELPLWEIVRRLCHTIKGSAAMVGMDDVSDEAWTAEQLAHTAIKEPAQRSLSRADRVVRLVSGIARLLAVPFNVPNPTPEPAVTKAQNPATPAAEKTPEPAQPTPISPQTASPPLRPASPPPVIQAVAAPVPAPKIETSSGDSHIDHELHNMFREEVSSFLKDLSLELARLRRSEQDVDIWEIVKRLCNTIKGSALMVGLEDISDEAWTAEQLAQTAIREPAQRTVSRADRIVRLMTGIAKKFGITFTVASPAPAVAAQD